MVSRGGTEGDNIGEYMMGGKRVGEWRIDRLLGGGGSDVVHISPVVVPWGEAATVDANPKKKPLISRQGTPGIKNMCAGIFTTCSVQENFSPNL